jgi:hypothetical protein
MHSNPSEERLFREGGNMGKSINKHGGETMNTATVFPKGIDDALAQGMKPKAKDAKKVLREVSKIANLAPEEAKLVSLAVGIWNQPLPPNEWQRRLDTEVVEPLAKLPRASRVKVVRAMSKALDLPISEVKELLIDYERRQNPKEENEKTLWEKVEPHPEPVLLQQVLGDLCEYIGLYVFIKPPEAVDILALWVVMTWVFDRFDRLPILLVTSPAPRSGKTTLFELLLKVVNRGLPNNSITPASMFRTIEKYHPTLFIDEADTLLRDNEDLTRIINSAHDSESRVTRCDPITNEPRAYNCFAPVALAGNNPVMAPATRDRCIEIKLKRKLRDDHCEKARKRQVEKHAKELLPHIARAVQDIAPLLETVLANLTSDFHFSELEDLDDRAYDCVEPLAIIALVADQQASGNVAGGAWFERAVSAIKTVVANRTETDTKHIQLLRDIKAVFDQTQQEALLSKELLTQLKQLDESPWDDLSERTLAKMVKPFEVKPKLIRFRDNAKVGRGYERQSFEDPWKRYL